MRTCAGIPVWSRTGKSGRNCLILIGRPLLWEMQCSLIFWSIHSRVARRKKGVGRRFLHPTMDQSSLRSTTLRIFTVYRLPRRVSAGYRVAFSTVYKVKIITSTAYRQKNGFITVYRKSITTPLNSFYYTKSLSYLLVDSFLL